LVFFVVVVVVVVVWFFQDRVSLCSPGCPGTHSVDQAGLELRNPPASASQVLGLKACATTTQLKTASSLELTSISVLLCLRHFNFFLFFEERCSNCPEPNYQGKG
jgi:hypothetical protein